MDVHTHALNLKHLLPYIAASVQNFSLYQYVLHGICNVHDKFQRCTVDVQVTMTIYNYPRAGIVWYVYIHNTCQYAPCEVTNT